MLPNTNTDTNEDRALSPVIAVVLLVGLTVVLVAVIGGIVTDTGGEVESAPSVQMSLDFNQDDDYVNMSHDGGNDMNPEQLVVEYENDGGSVEEADFNNAVIDSDSESGLIQAGDEKSIDVDSLGSSSVNSGDTIRIIWEGEGDNREIILEEIVP